MTHCMTLMLQLAIIFFFHTLKPKGLVPHGRCTKLINGSPHLNMNKYLMYCKSYWFNLFFIIFEKVMPLVL